MNKRIPQISYEKKVCIICEGYEEYDYIEKIISLNVWHKAYKFYTVNAEANGNIPARYQERYMSDSYDIVLVFCDTDKKPYEDYQTIKSKIDFFHGVDGISDQVVIYANPCTMQVILLHFRDVRLTSHKKEVNKQYIKDLTGIGSYRAKEAQRKRLFDKINIENYNLMKRHASTLFTDDNMMWSSNWGSFLNYFSSEDVNWIENINRAM
ncbi:RloB domain-containing protein [Clostridium sp. CM027]|uniref:RloB domain-containing protein n=1 Tax=Clostridium sp. CM027 TaxID=2849865 RepID=UPI001C6F33EF|nr:RloB domain-containing protein [Clostridium sp. CM027]MBW9146566.1 hypothetical protein [Clostridium sp. CM027]UVE42250.1 RloB domain-containing protein [Clostridium sp. CM027]